MSRFTLHTNDITAALNDRSGKTYDTLIRVSKLGGRKVSAESTITIDDQRDQCAYVTREAGGKVGRVFEARDQSGYYVTDSPQWREALARCSRGESNGIVVAYGDRLTRNWRRVGAFYDELENAGAEVIIAGMPNVDYRTPEGRAQTGMMAVMSDMQYQAAKTRGVAAIAKMLERGVPNAVAYGYRRNGVFIDGDCVEKRDPERAAKALVPDDAQREVVVLIFTMRGDGYSWKDIADELYRRGIPALRGGRWSNRTLGSIVTNRTYLGHVIFGATTKDEKTGRRVAAEPTIVKDAHEPLVTEQLFRRAQKPPKLKRTTRLNAAETCLNRTGELVGGLAQGTILCSGCSLPMSVTGGTGRGGRKASPSYSCRRRECTNRVAIRRDPCDAYVERLMLDVIAGIAAFDVFTSQRDVRDAHAAVKRAEAELRAFVTNASALDAAIFQDGVNARQAKLDAVRETHERARDAQQDADGFPDDADAWHAMDLDRQRRVVRGLLAAVVAGPPLSRSRFADVTERLTPVWRKSAELATVAA